MSWLRHVTLRCDACKEEFHDSLEEVVELARAEARRQGWSCRRGRDVGPRCLEQHKEPSP